MAGRISPFARFPKFRRSAPLQRAPEVRSAVLQPALLSWSRTDLGPVLSEVAPPPLNWAMRGRGNTTSEIGPKGRP